MAGLHGYLDGDKAHVDLSAHRPRPWPSLALVSWSILPLLTSSERAQPPPVRMAILVYAAAAGLARKPEEAVFTGRWRDRPVDGKYIGEQLRQAAELVGIQFDRPLHTLRHSYARALRRVEAAPEAVQAALDHSNLATTSIYLRQLEGLDDPWRPKLAVELAAWRFSSAISTLECR